MVRDRRSRRAGVHAQSEPGQGQGQGESRRQAQRQRQPMPAGYWPIWTTVLIDMIGFGIALPVLGIYAKDRFGATGAQVGLLGAAYAGAQLLGAPLAGSLSDRIGRKPLLIFSLIGTSIAALLTGFAGSIWALIVWRFVDGLTGASYGVANAAVADLAPPERRTALMGMMGAAFGIGFTVGPALGSAISWGLGRRAPFFVLAAMAAVNALLVLLRVNETRGLAVQEAEDLRSAGGDTSLARTWRNAGLPALFAIGLLTSTGFAAFENMFSPFGRDNLGLTQNTAGYALAIVGIVSVVVQGGLIRRLNTVVANMAMIRWGAIGTAVGLVMFGWSAGWRLLVPALIVTAGAMGFLSRSLSVETANRAHPLRRGAITGVGQSVRSAGMVAGPLMGGWLYDGAGHRSPFLVGAALFVVGALILPLAGGFSPGS